ncbi:MAG: hypothetical protein LBU94_00230 [Clostridiales bacterium]|jgi:ABC-type multidrug transport system fused ATPase/permease subunit|nr:hypothetical protein [Clostridiales bacterium]
MQYRLARTLNTLFIFVALFIVAAWAAYIFLVPKDSDFSAYFMVVTILVSVFFAVMFLWLEQNLDKRMITSMAKNGDIAIANIKSARRLRPMRDSSFNQYWLYEFDVDVFDKSHNKHEITFCDKLSVYMEDVPQGSVFITYIENNPDKISIIPVSLISFLPQLKDIVTGYENDKSIRVKYLDVFYKKGLVLRTFQEAFNISK